MEKIFIALFVYLFLVGIAYGMTMKESDMFNYDKQRFTISAMWIWALVPFFVAIVIGKWIFVINERLKKQ